MRYTLDSTWQRSPTAPRTVLAGSPLRVFRLTDAGAQVCDRIEAAEDVAGSSLVDRLVDAGAIHPRVPALSTAFTIADVTVVTPQLGGAVARDRDVVVDDGSVPPLDGATVRLDVNRGPAAARNAGRMHASTPLIAFVDADVTITAPDWLARLLPFFDDPRVGLVAPRVVGDPTSSLDLGDEPGRVRSGSRVSYVPAAAIVVRASAFDDVAGFDEALRFGEDVDFVWRLDAAGWRCRYEPAIVVHHEPRSTWRHRLRQQAGYGSAAAPLALRHPRALAPLGANAWMAAAWISLGLGHPLVAATLGVGNTWSVSRALPDVAPARLARLTAASYGAGLRQVATAIRRAWWPIALAAAIGSKRARWVAAAAVAADIRATPTDVAYGWGMWRGMIERRSWRPIVPAISSWPPEGRRRPADVPSPRPAGNAR